jgi:hypothetical protein
MMHNQSGHPISDVSFENLTFDFNGYNQTDGAQRDDRAGLLLFNITNLHLINIETMNCRHGASIRVYNCHNMVEENCYYHDNGVRTLLNGGITLPQATITVDSTTGFATAGKIKVGGSIVTYTGKTGTTFTGASGGTGAIADNTPIYPVTNDVNNNLLICDAVFHGSCQNLRVDNVLALDNTDTGTAMDGVVGAKVNGIYLRNALGVGVGFSNTEGTGAADSCEDIDIGPVIVTGLNAASVENQGVKVADFGNTGDGGRNRKIHIHDFIIRQCDRAMWIDDVDDVSIVDGKLMDAVGPNGQLMLVGTTGQVVAGIRIQDNLFGNTSNRGISFDAAGTVTRAIVMFNEFKTDVTGGTIAGNLPTDSASLIWNNIGYGSAPNLATVVFTINDGGPVLAAGIKARGIRVPFACTVIGWVIEGSASGSIVVDVDRARPATAASPVPRSRHSRVRSLLPIPL